MSSAAVPHFCLFFSLTTARVFVCLQFVLGSSEFEVDVRYMNLKPIGRGAYGLVASADDLVSPVCSRCSVLLRAVGRFTFRSQALASHHPCHACFSLMLFILFTLQSQITGRKVAIKRISKVFLDLIDAKRILREIKLLRHLG